jgi:hypothetical protein
LRNRQIHGRDARATGRRAGRRVVGDGEKGLEFLDGLDSFFVGDGIGGVGVAIESGAKIADLLVEDCVGVDGLKWRSNVAGRGMGEHGGGGS